MGKVLKESWINSEIPFTIKIPGFFTASDVVNINHNINYLGLIYTNKENFLKIELIQFNQRGKEVSK